MMVVPLDADGGFDGLARLGIDDGAMDAIEALLHVAQHTVVVVVPVHGHRRGIGDVNVGGLNRHFAALGIVVHVVLTAARNGVPLVTVDDTMIGVLVLHVHVVGVPFVALVGVFVADQFPPIVVGVERGMGVPRIVHHFGASMKVGSHGELVVLSKVHQP